MDQAYAIGIDLSGDRAKLGVVRLADGELVTRYVQSAEVTDGERFLDWLEDRVAHVLRIAALEKPQVAGIGLSIPGFVDNHANRISLVPESLAFMEQTGFREAVEERLGLPCRVEAEDRAIGLGEGYFGVGRDASRLLVLALGTGLGVAFLVNGRFLENTSIAHLAGSIIVRPGARLCPRCGQNGCLEILVSAQGLVLNAQEGLKTGVETTLRDARPLTAEAVFAAARQGDTIAQRAVGQLLDDLVNGLNSYICLFAPDRIVINGGMSLGLQPYLEGLRPHLVVRPVPGYSVSLAVSELQEDAAMLGGAALWKVKP